VLVPDDHARVVRHSAPGAQEAHIEIQVFPAERGRPSPKGRVEAAELVRDVGPKRRVRRRADDPRPVVEERMRAPSLRQPVDVAPESLAQVRAALKAQLRLGLELQREDEPGDAVDVVAGERRGAAADPLAVHYDVIVGEHDDVAARTCQPGIAGARKPGTRLHHVAQARLVLKLLLEQALGGVRSRTAVDDDDFEVGVVAG
jgi:hypothetical protein